MPTYIAPFERMGLFICLGTCGRVHLFPVAVPGTLVGMNAILVCRPFAVPDIFVGMIAFLICRPLHTLRPCCFCHWQRRATRPLPLAQVALSATGGAPIAPPPGIVTALNSNLAVCSYNGCHLERPEGESKDPFSCNGYYGFLDSPSLRSK